MVGLRHRHREELALSGSGLTSGFLKHLPASVLQKSQGCRSRLPAPPTPHQGTFELCENSSPRCSYPTLKPKVILGPKWKFLEKTKFPHDVMVQMSSQEVRASWVFI